MKKVYLSFLFLSLIIALHAQSWKVYEARYLPLSNNPAFTSSSPTGAAYELIVNPENANDSIYKYVSFPDVAIGQLWKYTYPEASVNGLTLVARVKGISTEPARILEFDLDNFGWRERVYVNSDNTYKMEYSKATGSLPGSSLDWHIYRMAKLDDTVRLYVDENPVPLVISKIPVTSTVRNYFRFGDGSGSVTYGGMVDWITWDVTGAYAPGEGAALPDTLVKTVPKLNVYNANELPNDFSANFVTSNLGGDAPTMNIIDDPDNIGNKLFEYIIGGAASKHMWRYNYPNNPQPVITLVARVKASSDQYDRAIELDMENGGWRDRLFVKNPNQYELKESATKGDLPVGTLGWHIYRLTKEVDSVRFYLDENPVPFAVVKTNTTSTNNYFRFGDGNGSSSVGGLIDWVAWDETGAYAPNRGNFFPDSLVTTVSSSDASLSTLTTSVGTLNPAFDPAVMSYSLDLPEGTTSITLAATANDVKASVTGGGDFTTLPGIDTITVTAEDGFTVAYTINVTLPQSTDASLQSLSASAGTLDPDFDPLVMSYNLVLPQGSTSVTFTATANNAKASVSDDGEFISIPGTATIIVTAENGSISEYTINVSVLLSDDASLQSLSASAGILDPVFDPLVMSYNLVLPEGSTSVTFTATANDPLATVSGGTLTSIPGTATITVTANSGLVADYTINVTIALSTDASLKSLTASVGTLDPAFDPNVTAYSLELPVGSSGVTLTAEANHANASVAIDGDIVAPGTATITVTASDGTTTKDYVITITVSSVGINQANSQPVRIYPNPAGNYITIAAEPGSRIWIHNSLGKNLAEIVQQGYSGNIDISTFDAGLYFVRIQDHNGITVRKLIKK